MDDREYLIETIEKIRDYISNSGKSQTEIARSIDISPASLSQFLSGTYKGDSNGIAEKLYKYLDQEALKATLPKNPTFSMTNTAKEIWFATSYAHANNDISLIYGEAGLGKSMALKEYANKHIGVIYIEARSCDQSTKAICERILKAIGKKRTGTDRVLIDTIIDYLKDSGKLLIIDEAQHLSIKAIEAIRSLNDEGNIGIVLSGNPTIYDRMYGRGEAHFAQLFSRIGIKREIPEHPSKEDIELIFEELNVNEECLDRLHYYATQKGGLRYMMKIYKIARSIALSQNSPLSIEYLELAKSKKDGDELNEL